MGTEWPEGTRCVVCRRLMKECVCGRPVGVEPPAETVFVASGSRESLDSLHMDSIREIANKQPWCSTCNLPNGFGDCKHFPGWKPPVEGTPILGGPVNHPSRGVWDPNAEAAWGGKGEWVSNPKETVNHPSHYNRGGIETIDYLESTMAPEAFKGFLQGNILKYMSRYPLKAGVEDVEKAKWYLDKLYLYLLRTGTPAK